MLQIEEDISEIQAGTFILIPKGLYHSFWNASGETTQMLIFFHPAGFEHFYKDWVALRDQQDKSKHHALFAKYDVILKPPAPE